MLGMGRWFFGLLVLASTSSTFGFTINDTPVFINELHYDNRGADRDEAVEIAGPAGTDLEGWSLVFYNGSTGQQHLTLRLPGVLPDQTNGIGTVKVTPPPNALQNGPDGFALVDVQGRVVQFLSYEGVIHALDGPAQGLVSTDIGVEENSRSPETSSLQLIGQGRHYQDFAWIPAAGRSFGEPNARQDFVNPETADACRANDTTPPLAPIAVIQGNGPVSPLLDQAVTVRGVVTGHLANAGGTEGYFLQDPRGDADPATSEGLYVLSDTAPPVGRSVQIQGAVSEHFGMTARSVALFISSIIDAKACSSSGDRYASAARRMYSPVVNPAFLAFDTQHFFSAGVMSTGTRAVAAAMSTAIMNRCRT